MFALFWRCPFPVFSPPPSWHFFLLANLQAATKASASCVLFLFEDAVVDTKTKYVFAIIGVFLLGFTNELFR